MPGFDIHPILVHFPIALLSVYALMEVLRFTFITRQQYWFYVKATFAIIGSLMTIPTGLAGKLAETHLLGSHRIVSVHSTFAEFSAAIFLCIGALYVLAWVRQYKQSKNELFVAACHIQQFIFEKNIIILLALVGLVLITITGELGGLIVFGPNIDPMSQFLFNTFFK